jgi:hypothetical protein
MRVVSAAAPSLAELRSARESVVGSHFPVHHDLADRLVKISGPPGPGGLTQDDFLVAHVLATCAGYAYSDAATLSMIMARMGLDGNRCLEISHDVDVMLICSTVFLVQSRDGRVVIVSYRGTRPEKLLTWLTGIDVDPDRISFGLGSRTLAVHAGFYRNVRASRYKVIEALTRAMNGEPITIGPPSSAPETGLEALYLTGHGLGGAMASLLAVMLKTDHDPGRRRIADKLYPVHTFGQPMIGDTTFARACERGRWDEMSTLGRNVTRWIHRNDVVTRLPPSASGDFAHFGQEFRFRGGRWQAAARPATQLRSLTGLAAAPLALLARQLPGVANLPFLPSLDDHFPQRYLARLAPEGVISEFGD